MLLVNGLCCRLFNAFLLSLICLGSNAQAGERHLTIAGVEMPLKVVFRAIKKQTGFSVMYNTAITGINQDEKVTVDFKATPLNEVLTHLFKGKSLEWTYNDDVIIIYKKEERLPVKSYGDSTVTPLLLTGRVTDANGGALSGVTIQVRGTEQGTVTDANGRFELAKVPNGELLVISSVGFETRYLTVSGRSLLVQLNMQVSALDETVVIAYGTTTKRMLVGNISTVKGDDIARQPVNNPLFALQGRVPGMFITQTSGVPGGDVKVQIQGQNSITNGNDPLYVVDGVPFPAQLVRLGSLTQGVNGGSPLRLINPADIASIDILKDADATAIYGSRAANGAVLITTKKGMVGGLKWNINLLHGWSEVARKVKMLDTRQYLDMRYEAYKNDGIDWTEPSRAADDLKVWDTTRYTDWQEALIGNAAQYTNVNVSVSGGSPTSQYIIGGTWHREGTVLPGDFDDNKASVHFSLSGTSYNRKFSIQLSGNYMLDRNSLPGFDATPTAIRLEPNAPSIYNSDMTLNWAPDQSGRSTWDNPLAEYTLQKNKNNVNNLISNMLVGFKPTEEIEIRCSAGYINTQTTNVLTVPLAAVRPEERPFAFRSADYGNNSFNSWIIEPQILYKKSIGKGQFDGLIGGSIQQTSDNSSITTGIGHSNDLLLEDIKAATSLSVRSSSSLYKYNALFGRLNYNWDSRYIVNVTARRDGSSRFGPKNRFHNFGSIGFAWIFSEYDFVKRKLNMVSFGKLRGSYGITGNDQIGDYGYLSTYFPTYADIPYQGAAGLSVGSLPNPYLQWEKTRKWQMGLDLGFFKDRLLLNATYANNRSSNQIIEYGLPTIAGYSSIARNFPATVQNSSWEFTVGTVNLKRRLEWTSSINLTIPRNKLIAFPGIEESSYANTLIIGQPLGIIRRPHFLGLDPKTGLYQIADSHGDPTSRPVYPDDFTALINTLPKFYGGMQNNLSYKGIQVNFLFQFVKQRGLKSLYYSAGRFGPGRFARGQSNQPATVLDRWQKEGDKQPIQRYSTTSLSPGFATGSDAGYADASFMRLKTLSASWDLPDKWLQKIHLQNCSFYVQGQNLLTITGYKGLDPENQSIETLPPLRTITVGINTIF